MDSNQRNSTNRGSVPVAFDNRIWSSDLTAAFAGIFGAGGGANGNEQQRITAAQLQAQGDQQRAMLQQQQLVGGPINYVDTLGNRTSENTAIRENMRPSRRPKRKPDPRVVTPEEREAQEAQEAAIVLKYQKETARVRAARKVRDNYTARQYRREQFLSNKLNLLKVWFWGLLGVSSYEVIRSILK